MALCARKRTEEVCVVTSWRERAPVGFTSALEACAAGVLLVEARGGILYGNTRALALFGVQELEGRPLPELLPDLPLEWLRAVSLVSMQEPEAQSALRRRECVGRQSHGEGIPVSVEARPLEGEEGLVLLTLQDLLEERREARRALRAQRQALQAQRLRDLGEAVEQVVGTFNLQLEAWLAQEEAEALWEQEGSREEIRRVLGQLGRARRLLHQMQRRAMSQEVPQVVELSSLLQDLLPLLEAMLPEPFSLELSCASDRFFLHTPALQVKQMLLGLVASVGAVLEEVYPEGRVNLSVGRILVDEAYLKTNPSTSLVPGEYVFLAMFGGGRQVDREQVRRVFEVKGVGHELDHLCRVAGGALIYGELGRRMIAKLLLPAAPVQSQGRAERARVLVVDDDAHVRAFLVRALELGGYQALEAEDGQEALEVFVQAKGRIGCVMLDLHMPVMGGAEAFGLLRARAPKLPIIFASSISNSEFVKRIKMDGHGDFLPKPFSLESFLASVHRALERGAEA